MRVALELDVSLDVPRFLPLGDVGDSLDRASFRLPAQSSHAGRSG